MLGAMEQERAMTRADHNILPELLLRSRRLALGRKHEHTIVPLNLVQHGTEFAEMREMHEIREMPKMR